MSSPGREDRDRWISTVSWKRSRRKASPHTPSRRLGDFGKPTPAPSPADATRLRAVAAKQESKSINPLQNSRLLPGCVWKPQGRQPLLIPAKHRLRQLRCSDSCWLRAQGPGAAKSGEQGQAQHQELLCLHTRGLSAPISQGSPCARLGAQPRAVCLADASPGRCQPRQGHGALLPKQPEASQGVQGLVAQSRTSRGSCPHGGCDGSHS